MKIELQAGDTITIPEDCRVQINGDKVTIEKVELPEFKDGDVLTLLLNPNVVFIYKEDESKQRLNRNGYYVCNTASNVIDIAMEDSMFFCGHRNEVRPATKKEKQFLFDKMKLHGLKWNAKEKRVEKIRWRAEKGESYWFINSEGSVTEYKEDNHPLDEKIYNFGNYFRTKEQAEEMLKRIKETFHKYYQKIVE